MSANKSVNYRVKNKQESLGRWKYLGLDHHKGAYDYVCEVCGDLDWIAIYGFYDELLCRCLDDQTDREF